MPLTGVTITVTVTACGWGRACTLASLASDPACSLHGAAVYAVLPRATGEQVRELVRHGFDAVCESAAVAAELAGAAGRGK